MATQTPSKSRSVTARAPSPLVAKVAPRAARTKSPATPTPPQYPDREATIREQAYFLYELEGCLDGHAMDHWLKAEAQITQGRASKS